jgi:hypothetical protein
MRVPFLIFVLCAGGAAALHMLPGLQDMALIVGLGAVAALVLILLAPRLPQATGPDPRRIWVDGSNVMYWQQNNPSLLTLVSVVDHLERLGYQPHVIFDANAGYLLNGAFRNARAFGQMLSLPARQVIVAPKGTPADIILLAKGRKTGLPIVTNDRYRDWLDQHPEIQQPGRLIRGGWRDGRPWVDVDAFSSARNAA